MKECVRLVGAMMMGLVATLLMSGCDLLSDVKTVFNKDQDEKPPGKTESAKNESGKKDSNGAPAVDVGFLLSMSFSEAKSISPQNLIVPPFYKIAADDIKVLSSHEDGTPKRVRAKGHVFLQIDYREQIRALGQEALLGDDEVILRGKPLMKRGRSVVEGLDDVTVFYIEGTKLNVIGKHRVTNEQGVTPAWRSTWRDGPNPLLPALSPDDVPKELRSSPLLPPPAEMGQPKP